MTAQPGRTILENIPQWLEVAMYLATLGAGTVAAVQVFLHVRRWTRGGKEVRLLPLGERLRDFARRGVAQRDIAASDRLAGAMHRLIFWGFVVLFVATLLTALEHNLGIRLLHGTFYLFFAFAADLFGLLFMGGLLLAIYRRYVAQLATLSYRRRGDMAALGWLFLVGLTGFGLEGARIGMQGWPGYERLSFVGWQSGLLMSPFVPPDAWRTLHRVLWGIHVSTVVGLFVSLPFTRLLHMFAAPANILLRARPLGAVRPIASGPAEPLSPHDAPQDLIESFTWKQLLELDACTSCGRCTAVCPATASRKPLSPMLILQHLREELRTGRNGIGVIGHVIDPNELWSCTTCAACEEICPISINHIDRIVDLRRVLVERGEIQPAAARALESMLDKGNPWDDVPSERAQWAQQLGVRVLRDGESCDTIYWVGCAGAYDEQGRKVSEAVLTLLKRAGVDFGILGTQERCSGDLARRIGEEGLFTELACRNTATLRSHNPRRVVTHCPHCLNTFRHEYALYGIEIVHHSVLLRQLVADGRLVPRRDVPQHVTFHDPCYLGRYNGIYEAPREMLAAIPQTVMTELPRSRAQSFCCGGGGGQVLFDVKIGERVPNLRFAEAEQLGIDVIATACPFCKIMLVPVPAERRLEGKIAVKDVAELLAEACV
ncbi:MAG: heterodisulfide reductase-related iron-sulfur binding cluster [Candidatus Binatia bacterium]